MCILACGMWVVLQMVLNYYCYLTLCGLVFLAQAVGGQALCFLLLFNISLLV